MILRTIFRLLWVGIAFLLAVGIALAALTILGGVWVGNELRAEAPQNPILHHGAPWLGAVLFARAVGPALTVLPALGAMIAGEVLRLRSWMYYVLAGGAALLAVPVLAGAPAAETSPLAASQWMTIFAAAGFIGGFVYWLLAGRSA